MSNYDPNSTKSYMQAMGLMMEAMRLLEIPLDVKVPRMDLENEKITPVEKLLAKFKDINTELVNLISSDGSDSAVVGDIKKSIDSIAQSTDHSNLYDSIKSILETSTSDEQIQSSLFDVLGFEHIELISTIIQNKDALLNDNEEQEDENRFLTPEERVQLLIDNQEKGKHEKLAPKSASSEYPHVYKKEDLSRFMAATGKGFALPAGTERYSYPTYEELVIPYPDQTKNKWISDSQLVKIKDLDFLCRGTFNYKTLNKMQSLVYPIAYNTNENMLVCAPTGAGKTDVAMLTILHAIDQYTSESVDEEGNLSIDIDYEGFKIIYVAPLKALAAEIVEKYSEKLKWLGIKVRELTGDMQLTKFEIMATQIIVTTPEKWDIVTRKLNGDSELVSKVKLLIIDEVHLLHEDRGSVIETLVARTLRQVESSQSMIRVVGLSATLPNYPDVADFLGVNRQQGMFYFDQSFRPVPLKQDLIGVRGKAGSMTARENLDTVSYDKLAEYVRQGLQVMVFVHQRRETVNSARGFISQAQANHELDIFNCTETPEYNRFQREAAAKNRNTDLRELFPYGFGVHNAGMLRSDRNLTEKMFAAGAIKVLCCTSTLAWGVNLPAAVVIIKGTLVYDAKKGGNTDLGISDVLQIFGRAGRPQYEQFGTGILCTTSDKLDHYISLITQQHPIESKLSEKLVDNLNAEISLGSVTNVEEGIQWLGYTYMMVRMKKNPFAYAIDWKELQDDPLLYNRRRDMIVAAARRLHALQMIIFGESSGSFIPKDLGRIASDFYLLNNSVEVFNQMLSPRATEADVLSIISMSSEFDSIKFRPEEKKEIERLMDQAVQCQVAGEIEAAHTKTNVLLQSFISQVLIKESSLVADSNYIAQNAARICRALFLIGINRRWGIFLKVLLDICKAIDRRVWQFDHPLAQFELPNSVLKNLRSKNPSIETLRDMEPAELGDYVHNSKMGKTLYNLIGKFPYILIDCEIFPISSNVMRLHIYLDADFKWDDQLHHGAQFFWVLVEESDNSELLHVERLIINKKQLHNHEMDFMVPLSDPLPAQLVVRVISDSWIGSETAHAISFQHLIRPTNETIRTNLLRLQPLPVTALHNKEIEAIYSPKFKYFNPMQTMTFFNLYNTNSNVFVGSPTGSGKTVVAELAIWHAFRDFPGSKIVYIAPMKALVRERVDDWRARIARATSHKVVELTGDSLPEAKEIRESDIIVTTPEKFDGISRNWQTRTFVQLVSLVIMDEIHLLASDRGPILEMIVSRMNYIASQTKKPIRLLGMSTAVSNAIDMAGWLGVKEGLFNFPLSVRPVPLQMYIDGFPDNLAFAPLMKTMNKPAFMAIKQHSPSKPVLIFVASRRQTRLTALDLIHLCGMEDNPRRFLKLDDYELQDILANVKDETLRLSLQFGMGLHHAGLVESDRQISHKLFEAGKIQILIATSTLAWGVNLPAHLVIIKGTQFFDSKIEGYRDMDLTDILQMMGRAGRPAFDTSGIAIVYTKESKKVFYKHFLNIGFPVESSLHKVLDDHIGAEISSGTITTRQEAMNFLTWTFLYRRAHNNPTYYGIEDTSTAGISSYLGSLIDQTIDNLIESKCVTPRGKDDLVPTPFLDISSYYYLSHKTIRKFVNAITPDFQFRNCLILLCSATEYDELATRHGEELMNMEMSEKLRYQAEDMECEYIWDPHIKAYLLLQAFMSKADLPIADYSQDTIAVLDQSLRILQAYIDAAAEFGYLNTVFLFIQLMQCIKQRVWYDYHPVSSLPGCSTMDRETMKNIPSLEELGNMGKTRVLQIAKTLGVENVPIEDVRKYGASNKALDQFIYVATHLPVCSLDVEQPDSTELKVTLEHKNFPLDQNFVTYCPQFPKSQRESWFIILADEEGKELLLIKRASPKLVAKKGKIVSSLDIPEDIRGKTVKLICINDGIELKYERMITLL